ncbi:tryptophan-rich protein TspO-like [Neodiprion fabricii]|uniref:tryptophan-rich protein TspO-like n=1 Tax=Neodiprion fabricii TaxID=2872261 RepID=UPI001ED8DCF4|nr:tryptophan-rich protein TspO-like [Neodiprion fabricii]
MGESKPHKIWLLIVAIILPNAGGWVGAALWQDKDWFENEVVQPSWRPPNWLFPVAWTIIYTLMGIASYYVWKESPSKEKLYLPLGVYCLQLIFNWFWTPLFFIWHLILVSLIDIVILWVLIVVMIYLFFRVSKKSALMLAPYIIWVTIATALNANYYHLNKDL